jgi:hypothetical protein
MTKSSIPADFSLIPAPMPEKPAPTTTTSWSGTAERGSRVDTAWAGISPPAE